MVRLWMKPWRGCKLAYWWRSGTGCLSAWSLHRGNCGSRRPLCYTTSKMCHAALPCLWALSNVWNSSIHKPWSIPLSFYREWRGRSNQTKTLQHTHSDAHIHLCVVSRSLQQWKQTGKDYIKCERKALWYWCPSVCWTEWTVCLCCEKKTVLHIKALHLMVMRADWDFL